MFDMTIPDHPLMRPVSKQPFIPADEKMRADCCSLAVTMQAHGLAARVARRMPIISSSIPRTRV